MIILKIIFLIVAIWFTSVNIMSFLRNQEIPAMNFVLMAGGIVGFIVLQFHWI